MRSEKGAPVTFGAGGFGGPVAQGVGNLLDILVTVFLQWPVPALQFIEGLGEAFGQVLVQVLRHGGLGLLLAQGKQIVLDGLCRQQVDVQFVSRLPVTGHLQHGGPAQAPVGDQHGLAKMLFVAACVHGATHPGQWRQLLFQLRVQGERYQPGAGG